MSSCLVSAADYRAYFEKPRCPECGHTSDEPDDFACWFCPSIPDRCNGCEIDPSRWQCPECWHEWDRPAELLPTEAHP